MTTLSSRASITSIAERSAWIIVMLAIASASFRLAQLILKMRRHLLVDVLEHRRDRRRVAVEERAVLRRLLQRCAHLRVELLGGGLVLGLRPGAEADQVLLQARDRVAERIALRVVAGAVARWIVRRRMRAGAVSHPLDQRRPEVGARALGRPRA